MERDLSTAPESELIGIITTLPSAIEPIGELALSEYLRRRSQVINGALEDQRWASA